MTTIKSNKELAPEEGRVYLYEDSGRIMAIARIGEQTFGTEVTRTEGVLTDEQWRNRKTAVVDMCENSLSFYEQHGRAFDKTKDHGTLSTLIKRKYPIEQQTYAASEEAQVRY